MSFLTATIGTAATYVEGGTRKAVEFGIKWLVKKTALDYFANNVANDPQYANAPLLPLSYAAMSAAKNCLTYNLQMDPIIADTLCLANATGFFMKYSLAPALRTYGIDPPSPDYQTLFPIVVPQTNTNNTLYQPLIEALACASAYLDGVNKSYDRYSAAYTAGDQISQDLQFGAIHTYLAEYGSCMLLAGTQMTLIAEMVKSSPQLNIGYDPSWLALIQEQLRADGLSTDLITDLQNMGFNQVQIDQVQDDILNIDPFSVSGTLSDQLTLGANAFRAIAFEAPFDVPEPNMALLFAGSGFALIFVQLRRRKSEALWH